MATSNAINGLFNIKTTTFTANGTWTKDANAEWVRIIAWGAGGGAASGMKNTSTSAGGGGGGASGGVSLYEAPASFFGASETVTIGSGGAGGASQTVDSNFGIDGTAGGNTTLGSHILAVGGDFGKSNAAPNFDGGAAGISYSSLVVSGNITVGAGGIGNNGAAVAASAVDVNDTMISAYSPTGGGGGAGADTGTPRAGGAGAAKFLYGVSILSGGAGGAAETDGTVGNAGISTGGLMTGGTGGGGAGGYSGTTRAGDGAVGGLPGGGGGGGGGGLNATVNSGTGGAGADGQVVVLEYLPI